MGRVLLGGRTPITQKHGAVATALGDVCLTPTPAGPVPLPYVNLARAKHLRQGSHRVTIAGSKIMLKGSYLCRSTGNELGRAGGILSRTTCGPAEAITSSATIRIEGRGVICDGEIMLQNRRNAIGRIQQR